MEEFEERRREVFVAERRRRRGKLQVGVGVGVGWRLYKNYGSSRQHKVFINLI